jgi:hypothetical protein
MRFVKVSLLVVCFALGCSSATATRAPSLVLVDGTGSSVLMGSIRLSASAQQSSAVAGVTVALTYKNVGTADTTVAIGGCTTDVRFYSAQTGGTMVYSLRANFPCTDQINSFLLHPGDQQTYPTVLYDNEVAANISANRYYVRVRVSDAAGTEVAAAVVDRQ